MGQTSCVFLFFRSFLLSFSSSFADLMCVLLVVFWFFGGARSDYFRGWGQRGHLLGSQSSPISETFTFVQLNTSLS